MKKQLSVFALHARAAIGRLALVLLGMLALDAAAYVLFGLRGFRASLTGSELVTALRVIFSLGLVACQLLLAGCFGAGSRYGYTLRRLQIPETRVLLWSGVCNALCFACVWCVQLMASVGTAALHAADARYAEGAQGIFVDFYRSEFLLGLLPLADGYLWVRNVVFVLALGVLTAYMQLGLRRKNGGRRLALVVLTGLMLRDTFGFDISMIDLALIGQYSENNFNGMNCGIMDQFASAMGKKDCAIFLDTNTLNYEYAPVKLPDARIVITNSKVKHSLVSSAYNDRRRESETALKDLQTVVDIKTLGDLTEAEFEAHKDAIKDPVCRKRAKHAVYENQRTIHAVEALKNNDIVTFGKLINESHVSLRDDYETSCKETDILAELAWAVPGVYGSRITGGGFGGCTVSIVKNDAIDQFIKSVGDTYKEKTGHTAEFYVVDIGDGARSLD